MARLLGSLLGFSLLVFTCTLILQNWAQLGVLAKIFVLVVPTVFGTVAILAAAVITREFVAATIRKMLRKQETWELNRSALANPPGGNLLTLGVLASVGFGLYAICEHLFG